MKKSKIIVSKIIFNFLLCCCVFVSKAEIPGIEKVDSLKLILLKQVKPNHEVDILNQLSRLERDRGNRQVALDYAKKARLFASKWNYDKGKIDAFLNLGVTERELGNYDAALSHLNQLIKLANTTNNFIAKGDAYDNVGHVFLAKNDTESALKYHLLALDMRRKGKDDYGIGNSCDNIASIYYSQDNYLMTIKYYKESLATFEKLKDDSRIALSSANLGMQFRIIGEKAEVLKYFDLALKEYEKLGNKDGVSWINVLIGEIYAETENHKQALVYYQKALDINLKLNKYDKLEETYSVFGLYYNTHNQPNAALKYFFKSLDIGNKNNDSLIITKANYHIAMVKWKEEKFNEALHHLEIAEYIADKTDLNSFKFASMSLQGRIFYTQTKYQLAKAYTEKSLAYHQLTNEKGHLLVDYQTLSSINEKIGDYKEAYKNYKLYKIYQDSIKLDDFSKTVMKYEFEKREAEIESKQQVLLRDRDRTSNIIYLILGLIIISTTFGLYMYKLLNRRLLTEKQNLELKKREAELAKENEEFKGRFLSNISHEFRTPLTLINGHLEILKKEGNPKDRKRYDEMENSGKRLLLLINQLLDLAKLQKEKYHIYYKKGRLLNEVQSYTQAFHSMAILRKINFSTEITKGASEKFEKKDFAYSSETLVSVFNNLISNALKFTKEGGAIHNKIDYFEGKLYISVKDTGSGIPEKDLPYVFDRFYQVVNKEKPIYEGSGIGLSIVKELALLHGGDVVVQNNQDVGCTFTVWLAEGKVIAEIRNNFTEVPLELPMIDTDDNDQTVDDEKPLVLVVEDQYELRKFIVENLGDDYRFLEAENGKIGTELALAHLPNVVISDVMMPEMNGLELCKILKEDQITSHIPIILLTAKAEQEDKIEGLETGADDYLVKPFSISELALRVKNRIRLQENIRKKFKDSKEPIVDNASGLNQRDKDFLEKLDKYIRLNIGKEWGVNDIASEIGLSASQLTRKLKIIIGQTPANFIKNIQMDLALQMLKDGNSVSETSWKIGFSEPAYFTKVFKKHFGFLPSDKDKFHSLLSL